VELISLHSPKSAMAEAYRSLRTAVLLSTSAHPPQILLVSSPQPAEGKTTVITNLAVLLAQRGEPVILIDSDMRKPRLHKIFGLPNDRGLSTYLTGTDQLEQTIVPIEGVPNLSVMTCGPLPPNPAELLSSAVMQDMLAQLRKRFTHILLDSPPIIHVTDAVILSSLSDGVILVAQGGVTTREALKRARKILHHVDGKLLGIVLNNVDVRSSDYSYYYGGRYYYYYYDSAEPAKEESSAEVPPAANSAQAGGQT
jgi:capsular exopolysaccharide synthesis family protein